MADALLWNLEETAHQLGDVSTRTVLRMIERQEINTKKVGRRRMVIAASVRTWLDDGIHDTHTGPSAGPDVRGETTCQKRVRPKTAFMKERIRRTGGHRTSTGAAKELAEVLAQPTAKKRRRS